MGFQMTDHLMWAFMSVGLAGGIPGDVLDVLVWKNVLKSPPSTKTRFLILFGTWIILGTIVSFVPDRFLQPIALCLTVLAVLLLMISLFINSKAK